MVRGDDAITPSRRSIVGSGIYTVGRRRPHISSTEGRPPRRDERIVAQDILWIRLALSVITAVPETATSREKPLGRVSGVSGTDVQSVGQWVNCTSP
jgi:hypothetical protein